MRKHELFIEGFQPIYSSPFDIDMIFMEAENILSGLGYEYEITITVNDNEHFIYDVNMNKTKFSRYIKSAVSRSCMKNLFEVKP